MSNPVSELLQLVKDVCFSILPTLLFFGSSAYLARIVLAEKTESRRPLKVGIGALLLCGFVLLFIWSSILRSPRLPGHARLPGYYEAHGDLPDVPEIVKRDCQKLAEGKVLFQPSQTMRQGQSHLVFARLARKDVNITDGLNGSDFAIAKERLSCIVSVNLDAEEPDAFAIEEIPKGRKDHQLLEPDKFSQWDWRVTPKKNGTLHLLLYVTPMLYVDGIGEQLKQFKQPPRTITVTPDYWYEFTTSVSEHWAIASTLLTTILIPLFLWSRTGMMDWSKQRFKKKDLFYRLPSAKAQVIYERPHQSSTDKPNTPAKAQVIHERPHESSTDKPNTPPTH